MKTYHIPGLPRATHYVNVRPRVSYTLKQIFLAVDLAAYNRGVCDEVVECAKAQSVWTDGVIGRWAAREMYTIKEPMTAAALSWALRYTGLWLEGRNPKVTNGRYKALRATLDQVHYKMGMS